MCARFKGPFKKSTFNYGMRMLERLFFRPTVKLGSAAIKDQTSPKKRSYSSYTSTNTSQRKSSTNAPNAQEKLRMRERSLEECTYVSSLVGRLTVDDNIGLDIRSGISKIKVAIVKYINKGYSRGIDFYSFAERFCSDQITNLKTDKSKWEYQIARKTIKAINTGYSYESIVQLLRSSTTQ